MKDDDKLGKDSLSIVPFNLFLVSIKFLTVENTLNINNRHMKSIYQLRKDSSLALCIIPMKVIDFTDHYNLQGSFE